MVHAEDQKYSKFSIGGKRLKISGGKTGDL